jgi:putative ABC transport system permease protein
MKPETPQRAERLFATLLGDGPSTRYIIGDLREDFARIARGRGERHARAWYVTQVIRIAARIRIERARAARRESAHTRHLPTSDIMNTELRQAMRFLRRRPAFTAAIVATLAIAISATTLTFAIVNGVLIEPLPYAEPDRLVAVWENSISHENPRNVVSSANFLAWRDELPIFEKVSVLIQSSSTMLSDGEPERVGVVNASAAYFDIVGAQPLIGRFYNESEDVEGAAATAVLSESYWQRRFGGDRSVIGRTITVGGVERTIVGVLSARYDFDVEAKFFSIGTRDVWMPLRFGAASRDARGRNFQVIARLAPGVTPARAQTEASTYAAQMVQRFPDRQTGWDITVKPLQQDLVGDARGILLIAFGAVCFFLLIACANVANLLMTRATERHQEIAVRAALGAGRGRLVRQLLTESMILSLLGAIAGVLLAWFGLRVIVAAAPDIPRIDAVRIDANVMAFAFLATVTTALLFGLLPALHTAAGNVAGHLRERGTAGRRGAQRLRGALVVAQMALSLVLLIGAGLLVRSLMNRLDVGVGFDTERLLTAEVQLPGDRYDSPEKQALFFEQLVDRIKVLPGVEHASAIVFAPLTGLGTGTSIWPADKPTPAAGSEPSGDIRWIHRNYPQTMGIELVAGRTFSEEDRAGRPYVMLINETAAREFWPDANPLGKRVVMPWAEDMTAEVVGVVRDIRHMGPDEPVKPMFYWEHRQFRPFPQMTLVMRTHGDAVGLVPGVRAALRELDPNLPLYNVRSMDDLMSQAVARPRFTALSLAAFAIVALLLAAIGTYAVMAYGTEQRSREIGIRIALGANRMSVVRMVVANGIALIVAALIVGTAASLALSWVLRSLVYDVTTTDPLTFTTMALVLALAGILACWLPARRASGIDPVSAIRRD